MSDQISTILLAVISTAGVILSGAFGRKWLANRAAAGRDRAKITADAVRDERALGAEARKLLAVDNEQARSILQRTVSDQDKELKEIRTRELAREREMAEVLSRLARMEERSSAQEKQIGTLQSDVSRWNDGYEQMKAERDAMKIERDQYRDAKHESDNKLTAFQLRAQMAETKLATAAAEIERLKGQLDAVTKRRDS